MLSDLGYLYFSRSIKHIEQYYNTEIKIFFYNICYGLFHIYDMVIQKTLRA